MVFEKLKSSNLSMKKSNCSFFSKEIQYLGHILSATGIRPLPAKTHAMQHMQPPMTPKQVTAFLGLVGYYRKFIKGFAKIAKPLTLLTRQQVKFDWTPEPPCNLSPPKGSHSSSTHSTTTLTQRRNTLYTQMLQMMPAEHNSSQEHNGTEIPSSIPFTYFHRKPNGNGLLLNKKPMAYTTPSPNETTTYKALTLLLEMTTNL